MGGISILMILAMMGAVTLAIIVAITLFIAATIISIVFAAQRKQRREQGKKLGALIALPIALYTVSIPLLIVFSAAIFIPFFQSSTTITYEDCSQAIISHDFEQLENCLDALELQLSSEGPASYQSLLYTALVYEDEDCVRTLLEDARANNQPIDLTQPLIKYDSDNNPKDDNYALCLATSTSFGSLQMIQMLLDYGAEVNSADEDGYTPLHNACDDMCTTAIASDTSSASLDETDAAIDLLLTAGADINARNQLGETPWDLYCETIQRYVDDGVLTEKEASTHLAERAKTLKPSE